jgi:hypothetical protein
MCDEEQYKISKLHFHAKKQDNPISEEFLESDTTNVQNTIQGSM